MKRYLPLTAVIFVACSNDGLSTQFPHVELIAQPQGGQVALTDPVGIDFGQVALYGLATATFKVKNAGPVELHLDSVTVENASGGTFVVESFPKRVAARSDDTLIVTFSPEADALAGSATVAVHTDAGKSGNDVARAQLRGVGLFVGEPNLNVCYGGSCYDLPEACPQSGGTCTLPPLAFGNVQLSSRASQYVRLRNEPPADTCLPPPGTGGCDAVCMLTFAANPTGRNMGVGLTDTTSGFSIDGNVRVPFELGTVEPACEGVTSVIRRELPLAVAFQAGDTEQPDLTSTLVLESDQPGAPLIEVPLVASARQGPVAVAKLRTCSDADPPPSCSIPDKIRPLERVYLDGRDSYDPSGGTLVDYKWTVLEPAPGADISAFAPEGDGTPLYSFWVPIAGRYLVRLTVTNDVGLASGVSATSDFEVIARPESRMHVQLVWDNPSNDLDLHVVSVEKGDLVYSADSDCFWKNCRPACGDDPDCTPVQWDDAHPVLTEGNPRLDIDDTSGLGPENVNVDAPIWGHYRIYVHYYGLVDPENVPTRATVRVYLDGIQKAEYRRTLERNDLWRVAEIDWLGDAGAEVVPATSDATGQVGSVQQLEYLPYPSGYNFGTGF